MEQINFQKLRQNTEKRIKYFQIYNKNYSFKKRITVFEYKINNFVYVKKLRLISHRNTPFVNEFSGPYTISKVL